MVRKAVWVCLKCLKHGTDTAVPPEKQYEVMQKEHNKISPDCPSEGFNTYPDEATAKDFIEGYKAGKYGKYY